MKTMMSRLRSMFQTAGRHGSVAFLLLAGAAYMAPPVPTTLAQAQGQSEIENFCSSIVDEARERRYALQRQELVALRDEIEQKIAALEEKRASYEVWATKREAFAEAANEGLVQVYAAMRPDAAAVRMEEIPPDLSAALLTKLKPRTSAAILNEMSPQNAGLITRIMAAAGERGNEGDG